MFLKELGDLGLVDLLDAVLQLIKICLSLDTVGLVGVLQEHVLPHFLVLFHKGIQHLDISVFLLCYVNKLHSLFNWVLQLLGARCSRLLFDDESSQFLFDSSNIALHSHLHPSLGKFFIELLHLDRLLLLLQLLGYQQLFLFVAFLLLDLLDFKLGSEVGVVGFDWNKSCRLLG